MLCRKCRYPLTTDLIRCPECGTLYDPTDARTFAMPGERRRAVVTSILTGVAGAIIAAGLIALILFLLALSFDGGA